MAAARAREKDDLATSPRPDVYTGMLIISLLATLTGIAFLWMDYREYPDQKPPSVKTLTAAGGGAPAAPRPAPGAQPAPAGPGQAAPATPGQPAPGQPAPGKPAPAPKTKPGNP
jgi:hypothetical protein